MDKRKARVAYDEGIRRAASEEFKVTEEGLRKLVGVEAQKIDKIVADIHMRHEKLLKRLDRRIKEEAS